jgi:hypothetical protein
MRLMNRRIRKYVRWCGRTAGVTPASYPLFFPGEFILTVCLRSDDPTPVTVLAVVSRIQVNAG